MSFDTTPQSLQPRASYSVPMSGFFGPRWREVLDAAPYNVPPRQYEDTLVITSGMCAICTFNWLVIGLVYLLNGFHWLAGGFIRPEVGDWGLAIIFLVALVRTCLHPITKMSQVQMMKMAKMGPALQKLKEKHGEDKEAFTRAQMELMKEQGMAPIFGCLPMFLQMPIWIALWQALQSTFELRQAPFLWGWTWIHDLSRPDYLIKFDTDYKLFFGLHLDGINLLPILMALIFYVNTEIQNRLQPKGTPEQESQKKMMKWMSTLLFPLFLYYGPSGLNLYILTSTLVGIIESKVIRKHIKEKEEAAKLAGPVVVDSPAGKGKAVVAAKRGGLMGWIQTMADRAEAVKRDADKKNRGGGSSGKGKR
jgi:YidC/Oxa1 family membrane protein insertase